MKRLYIGLKQTNDTIIAAGPLTKQPGTIAYRWVLFVSGPQIIMRRECFPNGFDEDVSYFSDGKYFELDELALAVRAFGDRVGADSRYMDSVYRD